VLGRLLVLAAGWVVISMVQTDGSGGRPRARLPVIPSPTLCGAWSVATAIEWDQSEARPRRHGGQTWGAVSHPIVSGRLTPRRPERGRGCARRAGRSRPA
jgi:hypothetical protein